MGGGAGLRDRKKAATRAALARAAWDLMRERGLAAVTPDAVAAAAGVSGRTFRNYFASREDAVVAEWSRRHRLLAERLAARPADEPLWESLERVAPGAVVDAIGDREDVADMARVIADSPPLLAANLLALQRSSTDLAAVVADRAGLAPDDLRPHLLAGSLIAALATAVTHWALAEADGDLPALLDLAISQLRGGFPLP